MGGQGRSWRGENGDKFNQSTYKIPNDKLII